MSVAATLARTFLGECPPEDLAALASGAHRRCYARGEAIFREGDPGFGLYVIEQGRVKVALTSSEGRERILALLGPGDVLGERAVLEGDPHSEDAVALEASTAIFLRREAVADFLQRHPESALRLLQLLVRRLHSTELQLRDAAFQNVQRRLAQTLLQLGAQQSARNDDNTVRCPRLTQSDLAHLIGATRESVNKWLRRFERAGLIRRSGGQVVLLDRERLEREVS